jgi:flagellar hook protein FlgE
MRSLWSGVSGLNAHQVAMDVEANNIANVNTVGFKYSRTNFQNLLSQTVKSATAPQGTLGGKNSLQVGLGTSVSAIETMFKQGSIQNTDKNTDMAINGNGFFVVSGDGGKTYKYTRAGDFTFDANGNFVDPNGFIVQGWVADPETHNIDTAKGLQSISIPPGLTTPANPTSKISIKANLNSGDHIIEKGPTRATLDLNNDLNGIYNANGEKIELTTGVDKLKFTVKRLDGESVDLTLTYGESESDHDNNFKTMQDLIDELNYAITHDSNGASLTYKTNLKRSDFEIYLNGNGQIVDPQADQINVDTASNSNKILLDALKALNGPTTKTSNSLKAIQNSFIGADDVSELFNTNGDAFNLNSGEGISVNIDGLYETRKFVYTSNPITGDAASCGSEAGAYQVDSNVVLADSNEGLHWTYANPDTPAFLSAYKDSTGATKHNTIKLVVNNNGTQDTYTFLYGEDFNTINDLCCLINTKMTQDSVGLVFSFDKTSGEFKVHATDTNDSIVSIDAYDDSNASSQNIAAVANFDSLIKTLSDSNSPSKPFYKNDIYYFHDIQDLVTLWKTALDDSNDLTNNIDASDNSKAKVYINEDGKLSILNTSGQSFNIKVEGYPKDQDNQLFTDAFSPINGTLANGGIAASQAINAAVHVTSMDIFDSLGAKHTLTFHFRKTHTSTGPTDPSVWKWYAEVPAPATLDQPANGEVKFNPDGSINSFNPPSLIFNPNNGASPGQAVQLDFGDIGKFDGLTSFEAPSSTSGQTQDGYPGGDLEQLVVDQTGTIIGVFTNGRSYSLAQVAVAKFVNNEGLMSEGGTLFAASPNSGDPIIGTAGTGGRGSIQPSSLEMSNVDLSRSLTQLIVIQRGFQANSKTITTSDQMLNTLLQLKQ